MPGPTPPEGGGSVLARLPRGLGRLVPHRFGPTRLGSSGWPAVNVVVIYFALVLLIPPQLIVKQVGAPGTPANGVAILLLLWWVAATLGGLNPVRGWTPMRICAGLLALCILASYANGMVSGWYAPPTVRQETDELWTLVAPGVEEVRAKMISAADRGLLSAAGWLGLMLMVSDSMRSWADLERLVMWLTRLGVVVALIGILQFFTGYNLAGLISVPGLSANADYGIADTRSVLNRVSSTATHAIEFGVVTAALLPMALHRMIHRWGHPGAGFPALVIGVACSMSVSRSGVLVLGAGLLVLMWGWPPAWRLRTILIAPVLVVALRLAVPGLVGTLISLFRNLFVDDSIDGRTGDYGVVFHVTSEHPWFGRGLFTFVPRYYRILDSEVLMLLLELGIIGLLVSLSCYIVTFFSARRAWREAATAQQRHLGLVLAATISGLFISLLTYDAWGYPMATGLTFVTMGMAGAAWRLTREQTQESAGEPGDATVRSLTQAGESRRDR